MKIDRKAWFARKLAAIPDAVVKEMRGALSASASEMVDVAKRFAPVDSGALKNSIDFTFGDYKPENSNVRAAYGGRGAGGHDLAVTVHAGNAVAWYAGLVEYGTMSHTITAKNHPVLVANGKVLGKSVEHPGGAAQPFFGPAFRLTKKRMRARLARGMKAAIKKGAA